ncbi:hypothetical protein D1BOALGB6SA_1525 [Olavius sp. associated proteobacterium Delta 1]|nr:hypothetical protein D1BOALGB6SA_1525 [Olavius sp. associated proteobacterium Delta 1]
MSSVFFNFFVLGAVYLFEYCAFNGSGFTVEGFLNPESSTFLTLNPEP